MKSTIKQYKNLIFLVLLVLLVTIVIPNIHIIPTGYTGVRTTFGQIQEKPVESGCLIFTVPFVENIRKVNNKQQDFKVGSQIWGETDDKTPVYARDVTVTYQIASARSAWIYANVSDYTKSLITESLVASAVKAAMVELAPGDVTNRSRIEPLIQEKLQQSLDGKYGEDTVYINKITVGDMDFEAAYNDAIQAKSIAAQAQAKAQIENQTAIAKADADKKVAVTNAEAKAEQARIAAQAEADANRMIQESLTDELIEVKKIDAWDGRLPSVVGSETLIGFGVLAGSE